MLYHGIDTVEINRIALAVARWGDRFLRRVWTDGELADANGRLPSLAARYAAKEATAKALGCGLRGLGAGAARTPPAVGWREIEVVRATSGQPLLRLHGQAAAHAAALGWESMALSLTHTAGLAMASVVASDQPPRVADPPTP